VFVREVQGGVGALAGECRRTQLLHAAAHTVITASPRLAKLASIALLVGECVVGPL
jgi:hypothetical protein